MAKDKPRVIQPQLMNTVADSMAFMKKKLEYSGGLLVYVGFANPGQPEDEAGWMILKNTYDGNDLTDVQFANGASNFEAIWDDRASYNYS